MNQNSPNEKKNGGLPQQLETDIFQLLQRVSLLGVGLLFSLSLLFYYWIKSKPSFLLEKPLGNRKKEGIILVLLGIIGSILTYNACQFFNSSWTLMWTCFSLNSVSIGGLWFSAEWILYGFGSQSRLRVDDLRRKVKDFSPIAVQYKNGIDTGSKAGFDNEALTDSAVKIGISPITRQVISISQKSRNMHCLFAGGSGFGKTTLLKTFLLHSIKTKEPVIIIDAKGSQANIDEFRQFAEAQGLPSQKFYVFSISNPDSSDAYNPIRNGSVVQKQDRLFAALEWSEIFYQSQATAYLSKLFPVLSFYKLDQITLGDVREFMTDISFRTQIAQDIDKIYTDSDCPEQLREKTSFIKAELIELEKWDPKTIAGLKAQMMTIDKESYGSLFRPKGSERTVLSQYESLRKSAPGSTDSPEEESSQIHSSPDETDSDRARKEWEKNVLLGLGMTKAEMSSRKVPEREIDLKQVMQEGGIIYFQLSTMAMADSASRIGRLILEDLKWLAAEITAKRVSRPNFFPVFIDEFGEFASNEFPVFLEQCREANMGLHLFFQGIGNLQKISPDFADRMIESTAVKGIMSTSSPGGVDTWAGVAGTVDALENSRQVLEASFLKIPTGMGNQRETKQMIVEHDVFRRLQPGQMVLVDKFPSFHVDLVQVWNPSQETTSFERSDENIRKVEMLGSHYIRRTKI